MCGRYLIDDEAYADLLLILHDIQEMQNEVFPSNIAPVITQDGIVSIKWGFPHWKNKSLIINARAETAFEKNMFRKPLFQRRCAIPASGYFEWANTGESKKKDKFLLRQPSERVLYLAGMISTFKDPEGIEYSAFVILTTTANESVSPIHNRMPVIIAPDEKEQWIYDIEFAKHALSREGPQMQINHCVNSG